MKVISSSQSRYSPTHNNRGVDKRASQLNKEYQDMAKNADRLMVIFSLELLAE